MTDEMRRDEARGVTHGRWARDVVIGDIMELCTLVRASLLSMSNEQFSLLFAIRKIDMSFSNYTAHSM
jgi:hypothetical protein